MLNKLMLISLLVLMIGCGFKGPLYIPNNNAEATESSSNFTFK